MTSTLLTVMSYPFWKAVNAAPPTYIIINFKQFILWLFTFSRSTFCCSQMHKVRTPLSWRSRVEKARLSSNNDSKWAACWKGRSWLLLLNQTSAWTKTISRHMEICLTNRSIIGSTVQDFRQVDLTTNRTDDTSQRINTMYLLLKFLQIICRTLCSNQINLVKNYNILQQTGKFISYKVQDLNSTHG